VPVRARRRYQGGNTVDQLQGREVQFVGFAAAYVFAARFAVLLATAVDEFADSFDISSHGNPALRPIASASAEVWIVLITSAFTNSFI
jgi:hypothetical protein